MSWTDEIFPASFNGIPFSVQSHNRSGGQRLAIHEFPYRDRPQVEFMGRKANDLHINAVLVGNDYLARRDQLLHELNKKAIGELIHPWLGILRVAVQDFNQDESWDYAGSCRLTLTFIDADAVSAGSVLTVTSDAVTSTAAQLSTTAQTALATTTAPSSPASLAERVNQLEALAVGFTAQINQLQGWADTELVAPVATVLRSGQSIRNDLQRLAALPVVLADTLSKLAAGIFALFDSDPDAGFKAAMNWANTSPDDDLSLWRCSNGVAYAAQFLAARSFDNSGAATSARDQLLDAIENLQTHANDDLYVALIDVRSTVVADIAARGQRLPLLITYTPKATLPALVIAHQLYGDATRAADVITRNNIPHPGFVPGGRALEVLSNG